MFYTDIEHDTINNNHFRKVIHTSKHLQLVLMNLRPKQIIPKEVHKEHDQFIRIEKGFGKAIIFNDINEILEEKNLYDGISIIIPAGTIHEIQNTHDTDNLKLYTIYTPPEHPDKLTQDLIDNELIKIDYENKLNKYHDKIEILLGGTI